VNIREKKVEKYNKLKSVSQRAMVCLCDLTATFVFITGYYGGMLVYEHGVGVEE
jgi:uncharacterized membrane protein